jgi:Putative peptidoglycan binding domain
MVILAHVQYGNRNEDIRTVQNALIRQGHNIPGGATGYFGDQTREAYASWQESCGYSGDGADGNPGCLTLTELGQLDGFTVDCTSPGVPSTALGRLTLAQVTYQDPNEGYGKTAMEGFAKAACELTGMDPQYGVPALVTITKRESAYNDPHWRVNTHDSNAHGPIMPDGHPQYCSRGATQCIPPTFAYYHQARTATTPYDVVADMCATVNYVRVRYAVNHTGSNFASHVQQADPNRPPAGY